MGEQALVTPVNTKSHHVVPARLRTPPRVQIYQHNDGSIVGDDFDQMLDAGSAEGRGQARLSSCNHHVDCERGVQVGSRKIGEQVVGKAPSYGMQNHRKGVGSTVVPLLLAALDCEHVNVRGRSPDPRSTCPARSVCRGRGDDAECAAQRSKDGTWTAHWLARLLYRTASQSTLGITRIAAMMMSVLSLTPPMPSSLGSF